LPLWAFVACYRVSFTFTLIYYYTVAPYSYLFNLPSRLCNLSCLKHHCVKHLSVSCHSLTYIEWRFTSVSYTLMAGDQPHNNLCYLTLNLLTTTIVAPPSNASKWQMGSNSAFKGLNVTCIRNARCFSTTFSLPSLSRPLNSLRAFLPIGNLKHQVIC
jgi:hypothetical protein